MRRDNNPSIRCNINLDKQRPQYEKGALWSFRKEIEDFDELPVLIEEAARLMGLDESKAFARDVLSIEICGPGRPQL